MLKPHLGASSYVLGSTVSDWHIFTCHMYGKKNLHSQDIPINHLRYNIYFQNAGKVSGDALPPCWNTLKQYIKRVNYQTKILRECLQVWVEQDSPLCHRWCMKGEKLDVEWMTCSPAPEEAPFTIFFIFELFLIHLTVTVKFFKRKKI